MEGKSEARIRAGALTGRMRVNGWAADASLTADGKLRWWGEKGERCLALESEALGLGVEEEGCRIRVRAFVSRKVGKTRRIRKDLVLEMESDEMVNLWSERLRECFNSFSNFVLSLYIFYNLIEVLSFLIDTIALSDNLNSFLE